MHCQRPPVRSTASPGDDRQPAPGPRDARRQTHRRQGARACSPLPKSWSPTSRTRCRGLRHPLLRSARRHAAPHRPGVDRHGRVAGRRHGVRRLVDPGFQAINESDMTLLPDVSTARVDPFRRRKHAELQLLRARSADPQPYSRDPRNVARKAEEYLASTGIADTCYFGAGGRVLRLRRRALRLRHERLVLQGRLRGGLVEHRPRRGRRQPRLQGPVQGRLLPGPAVRPPRRPARGHDREPDQHGLRRRARAPRGGHRRPGRDQLQVQHPAAPRPTS